MTVTQTRGPRRTLLIPSFLFATGGAAVATSAAVVTGAWQLSVLAGLAWLLWLLHLVAWRSPAGTTDLWVTAVNLALLSVALLIPVLVSDVWVVATLVALTGSLHVGLTLDPRGMPAWIAAAMLTAAGVVAIDLIDLPLRLKLDLPLHTTRYAALALGGYMAVAGVVLYRRRLRPGAPDRVTVHLATQLSLVLIGIAAASLIAVSGALISQIRDAQVRQVGGSFEVLARMAGIRR